MNNLKTHHWIVDKNSSELTSNPQIKNAAMWISRGEVVAFPTETVYGLGANALSDQAISKIYEAKGRPSDNPLIVHISNINQLNKLVKNIPAVSQKLMDSFWPGPLTIIFESNSVVSPKVTAGLQTVAIRMPDHPVALALIEAADAPVAAPSANLSGKPSPTNADHVLHDLNGRIAGVVDGGATGVGVESTVIDCTCTPPIILRPGGVTREEIEAVIGSVAVDKALLEKDEAPKSPGMKYTHYAPKAPLYIVDGPRDFIQKLIDEEHQNGKKVGMLTTEENKQNYNADIVITCGYREDLKTVAHHLYDSLRAFDEEKIDIIFSESFPQTGVGEAVMNRLSKAAGGNIIKE
ncbi:L-threonylcarbamoyladenylate synthase [Schinkia azotoformans]|uniref:L-threonylcarbamoyladenylate synthase n=1 Tax=Schinkia azotoformans TaxID=1454 RepID=UPI002DB6D4DA|nr:L-threonylcarbamoyladenylate synthase [Schinkia azotoformans]MEC1719533.1 L-threonylcarbamoyladenylate synthase [Schinkia azotoformans]MED4413735.1 L-threonylcarbamoyladenylate synthase [Schinkia azotoformans]